MSANVASAMRSPFQLSVCVSVRTHAIDALPAVGAHVAHAHRRRAVHQQHDVGARAADDGRDALRPRERENRAAPAPR